MRARTRVASPRAINVADLRRLARARLPDVVFDYLDGGAEDEITLKANSVAFCDYGFRPRHGVSMSMPALAVEVMGQTIAWPAMLAPIGLSRLIHPEGEAAAARAAGRAGTGYILSTVSGYPLEEVAADGKAPLFYQLYLIGGRAAAEATLARAAAAGFKGLFVTIDTPVAGMRERDFRNGMAQLLGRNAFAKMPYVPDILAHPRWLARYCADKKMKTLPNVVLPGGGRVGLTDVPTALASSVVTWDDLSWIRQVWKGPIAIKGVLTVEDARRAVDVGATALVVSNHGGRQLDGVAASLRALPAIAAAVGDQIEVLMDGGIRRGSDIVKALALGARAVLLGRGYAYGMAAAGEAGIDRALEIFHTDLVRTMKLLGCYSVADLNPSYLERFKP
jgi:L-lactate dehydrogenase (cytochrome)